MLNIHLADDQKFINQSLERFEKSYPSQNFFLININKNKGIKFLQLNDKIDLLNFDEVEVVTSKILELSINQDSVSIFVHFLTLPKAKIIAALKTFRSINVYWIFYGADLYKRLYTKGKYDLYDAKQKQSSLKYFFDKYKIVLYNKIFKAEMNEVITKFIKELDYFCFWNPLDYELLTKHYKTTAKLKLFRYGSFSFGEDKGLKYFSESKNENNKVSCLINHSASRSGNHFTILKRFKEMKVKDLIKEIIVPLNYGPPKIIKEVHDFTSQNFGTLYVPMLNFIPKNEYAQIIDKVDIAFFGHRRQEAGGNIIYLLANGAKLYLRDDNNLLEYFKDLGVYIYSFEKDFSTKTDLQPLSVPEKINNRKIILEQFSEDKIDLMYSNLLM